VIVPLSDEEVLTLSKHKEMFAQKGVTVMCSDHHVVQTASDKGQLLTFLQSKGTVVPDFYCPTSLEELDEAVARLGYPEEEVVLKPTQSRGARGFWILSEKLSGQDLLFKSRDRQRIGYPVLRELMQDGLALPSIVVMQYLRGPDFNVDVLAWRGETLYCIPIQRLVPSAGPVQDGLIVHDPAISALTKELIALLGFSYNINIEMAYPNQEDQETPLVYEINARVSAPIAVHQHAGINMMLFGILLALGYEVPRGLPYEGITVQRYWSEHYGSDRIKPSGDKL